MPIYEFECRDCQKVFEVLLGRLPKADSSNRPRCLSCGSKHTERVFSTFGIGSSSSCASCSRTSCASCQLRR